MKIFLQNLQTDIDLFVTMIQDWSTLLEDSLSKNTLNISIKIQFRYSAVSVWEDYNKNTLES